MKRQEKFPDTFTEIISKIVCLLRAGETVHAHALIGRAMGLDMGAPEPHNLLGIFCEMTGDDDGARRHYRAAYALDPTYRPACRNLERLVLYTWGEQDRRYDFGNSQETVSQERGRQNNG